MPDVIEDGDGAVLRDVRLTAAIPTMSTTVVGSSAPGDDEGFVLGVKLAKASYGGVSRGTTRIGNLPGAVLTTIFSLVSSVRARHCVALVCRDWYYLERQTRVDLTLRGNMCNFLRVPLSFASVTRLDLSFSSPWGYSIFQTIGDGEQIGQALQEAFPAVKDLAIYVRNSVDIRMMVWLWPELEAVRLVRWHQRATDNLTLEVGSELEPLFGSRKLQKLDLSEFYCWTEDIAPALELGAGTNANLRVLNLLNLSPDGFKTQEILDITAVCGSLEEFFLICGFDPRFLDAVGDRALESIATNCPRLRVLHLVDAKQRSGSGRRGRDEDGPSGEHALVTCQGLEVLAKGLPDLEDLAILLGADLWDSRPGLEALFANCQRLSALQLSLFHGLCSGVEPDGLAAGAKLRELSIRRSVDLSDEMLISVAASCKRVRKLTLASCRAVSERGLNACAKAFSKTLVDVEISACALLPTVPTLRALDPVRDRIRQLHLDCVWDDEDAQQAATVTSGPPDSAAVGGDDAFLRAEMAKRGLGFNFWQSSTESGSATLNWGSTGYEESREIAISTREVLVVRSSDEGWSATSVEGWTGEAGCSGYGAAFGGDGGCKLPADRTVWKSLQKLSLWIGVGLLISPLPSMGLGQCPALTEVSIKVEGDTKNLQKPAVKEWGLAAFSRYKNLRKVDMDLGDMASFSLSAPEGHSDLAIWERHYLSGVADLNLRELNYWPPWDKDLNYRGTSLPAVGHLSQCLSLRKLVVHGTMNEHFLSMLYRNTSLRDFQLRWDIYPAPEVDTSTDIRVESCRRFEEALAERGFLE